MKLAFLISAHTDPQQLRRLVASLPDDSDCYIHIDRKSDIRQFTKVVNHPRAHFIQNRQDVVWGSWIETQYQIELIKACLKAETPYDYLITLSGLDYPVWSNERIIQYFEAQQGRNVLQGIQMQADDPASRQYQEYRFLNNHRQKSFLCRLGILMRKVLRLAGVKKPLTVKADNREYHLYKGAAWWAITPQLATRIVEEWEHNKRLANYFKSSFCPAETFVQTVAFNSEFASQCILTTGRYQSLQALTPFTYIDYVPVIKLLTEEDYDKIQASDKMFCRKIVSGKSDGLVRMIDDSRRP